MRKMEVFDVSMTLSEDMVVYEGDPTVRLQEISSIGEGVRLSEIRMGLHAGTHVDAPSHYLVDGASIDQIPLIVGKARVCDLSSVKKEISPRDLKGCGIRVGEAALFKTSNSRLLQERMFSRDFVSLSLEGAEYLVEKKARAVGIDYLSIESFYSAEGKVHKLLLENNISIIEGLDLGKISPGVYDIFCLPLRVRGGEAAPARCILLRQ